MIRLLKSTRLAVFLCLVLAAAGIAGSLLYNGNTAFGKQGPYNVFRSPIFLAPAGLLLLNVLFCAGSRLSSMPFSRASTWTFAGIHLGLVFMASGLLLDGAFGFIGTRYFYRGVPDSSYFDWKMGRTERFPFTVEVTDVATRFHPFNLRIGIRDPDGKNVGVYTVREGGSIHAGNTGLVVTARRFDVGSKTLTLDAAAGGMSAGGIRATAADAANFGGYSIMPVEYADPEPAEHVARVRFTPPGRPPEEREIRVNGPARFAGLYFCLVDVGADRYGNPYAGLQMTREPGEGIFWSGAMMFFLALVFHFRARMPSPESSRTGGAEKMEGTCAGAGPTAAVLAFLSLCSAPSAACAFGTVIDGKDEWAGEIRVAEPVTVGKGALLRILPGTTVLMSGEDRDGDGRRDGFIRVLGTFTVEGEKGRPVRFVRMHPDKAWEEIFLEDAVASVRHAVFEGASWGLHVHDGAVKVEHATFRKNRGGARLKGTGAEFSRCTFRWNTIGLRFWDGGPTVSGSIIEGNGTGLFYREGMGGGKISGNMIANREWNLKVGDWAKGDLDASGNYWGGGGNGAAELRVEDFREVKDKGRIVLLPVLLSPPSPCGADGQE